MKSTDQKDCAVVLVIEDELFIRLSLLEIVADAGFEALEAANADEAIQILESRGDIRVIFTDIKMPGSMDGLELAHAVRHRWPPIRIIVTSGYISMVDEKRLPAGSRFLLKPYRPAHIVEVLRELAA